MTTDLLTFFQYVDKTKVWNFFLSVLIKRNFSFCCAFFVIATICSLYKHNWTQASLSWGESYNCFPSSIWKCNYSTGRFLIKFQKWFSESKISSEIRQVMNRKSDNSIKTVKYSLFSPAVINQKTEITSMMLDISTWKLSSHVNPNWFIFDGDYKKIRSNWWWRLTSPMRNTMMCEKIRIHSGIVGERYSYNISSYSSLVKLQYSSRPTHTTEWSMTQSPLVSVHVGEIGLVK